MDALADRIAVAAAAQAAREYELIEMIGAFDRIGVGGSRARCPVRIG